MIEKVKEFLLGVRAELEKVSWPEVAQVRSATVLIMILVFVMAVIIGLMDLVITQAMGLVFKI